jgi:hypothetical protein
MVRIAQEKIRSSSSRRAPPIAASNPWRSIACFRASVFITRVCTAEPADRINARPQSLLIDMRDQLKPERLRRAIAESDHIAKFPCRTARVEAACRRGNDIGATSYGSIKSILQHGLDRAYAHDEPPPAHPIHHHNIRGNGYYH